MAKPGTARAGVLAASALALGACSGGAPPADASSAEPAAAAEPAPIVPAPGDAVQVKKCSGELAAAADGLIDDLEDNDNAGAALAGRAGYWWAGSDDKGSSIEPRDLKGNMADGGAGGSKKALHVSGKTASADGAWGANVGVGFGSAKQPYDASKYAGVAFFIKAGPEGTKNVRVKISDVNTHPNDSMCKDGCWNHFGKDLVLGEQWQEVKVAFVELSQQDGWGDPRPPSITPNKVFDISWQVDKGQQFDLWIDDVRFVDCK